MDTDLIGIRIYNAQNLKHFQAKQGETLYCYSWPTLHGIKVTTTFTTLAGLDPPCIVQCTMGKRWAATNIIILAIILLIGNTPFTSVFPNY